MKMSKLTLKPLRVMVQPMIPTLWSAQQSNPRLKLSKESLTEDSMLIMLMFLQMRTILWFKLLMTLILPGKLILVNFKSIMPIMGHIAKNTKNLPSLKQLPTPARTPKPVRLDNKRTSRDCTAASSSSWVELDGSSGGCSGRETTCKANHLRAWAQSWGADEILKGWWRKW